MGPPNGDEVAEFRLTAATLRDYLAERGLVQDPSRLVIRELGGGVSNLVLLVEGPHERWVAKQSLGKLRVKDDWRSKRDRILREASAIAALGRVLGAAVPRVIHMDRERYLYLMTAAPQGSVTWKQLLLGGEIDCKIGRRAGILLAKMIGASRADPTFQRQYSDRRVFDELRIDPYYRTTAARVPEVRDAIARLTSDSGQIQTALVHGDYSPKNMLVSGEKIFLIDFEVVHWGDPAFDAAFLLNHLALKAFYRPEKVDRYIQAAREFWEALTSGTRESEDICFERMTVRHLGGLMLARIDGKSPVEYLRDEATKKRVRQVAKRLLLETPGTIEESWSVIRQGLAEG